MSCLSWLSEVKIITSKVFEQLNNYSCFQWLLLIWQSWCWRTIFKWKTWKCLVLHFNERSLNASLIEVSVRVDHLAQVLQSGLQVPVKDRRWWGQYGGSEYPQLTRHTIHQHIKGFEHLQVFLTNLPWPHSRRRLTIWIYLLRANSSFRFHGADSSWWGAAVAEGNRGNPEVCSSVVTWSLCWSAFGQDTKDHASALHGSMAVHSVWMRGVLNKLQDLNLLK